METNSAFIRKYRNYQITTIVVRGGFQYATTCGKFTADMLKDVKCMIDMELAKNPQTLEAIQNKVVLNTTPTTPKPTHNKNYSLVCWGQENMVANVYGYRSVMITKKVKKGVTTWQFVQRPSFKDQRKRVTHTFGTPQECVPAIDSFLDWTHIAEDGTEVNWQVNRSEIVTLSNI